MFILDIHDTQFLGLVSMMHDICVWIRDTLIGNQIISVMTIQANHRYPDSDP